MKQGSSHVLGTVWFLLLFQCEAICPNSCSGHGFCGSGNTCDCFEGWWPEAADCSLSELFANIVSVQHITILNVGSCPIGQAWADKAYAIDSAHQSVECSGAGLCDRHQGRCLCFDGYSGAACQRSVYT